MKRTSVAAAAAVLLTIPCLLSSSASATPATGTPTRVTTNPPVELARPGPFTSTLDGPLKAKDEGITLKAKGDVTVRNFFLTYPPTANSGWHRHPGLVMASVVSGTVTRQLPCKEPETFVAGQAFVEVGPHLVQNAGSVDAVLAITQLIPAGTDPAKYRKEVDAPRCHPRS